MKTQNGMHNTVAMMNDECRFMWSNYDSATAGSLIQSRSFPVLLCASCLLPAAFAPTVPRWFVYCKPEMFGGMLVLFLGALDSL
jgi:hypothetical protein